MDSMGRRNKKTCITSFKTRGLGKTQTANSKKFIVHGGSVMRWTITRTLRIRKRARGNFCTTTTQRTWSPALENLFPKTRLAQKVNKPSRLTRPRRGKAGRFAYLRGLGVLVVKQFFCA